MKSFGGCLERRELASSSCGRVLPGIVWIIVPVFDRFQYLQGLYNQVSAQSYAAVRLVVVDHGTREIPSYLRRIGVDYIRGTTADWWSGAINKGIDYVVREKGLGSEDYILFQNDDVQFDHSLVERLVDATQEGADVVGAITVDRETKRILVASTRVSLARADHLYDYQGLRPEDLAGKLLPTELQMGRGVLYRADVVRCLGKLNEHLRYRADPEYAHRAHAAGFRSVVSPKAVVATERNTHASKAGITDFRSSWAFLFAPRSTANLPDAFHYFRSITNEPLAIYCFLVHSLRTVAKVFYSLIKNVIRRILR